MYKKEILAMIPARLNSKRIVMKNIRFLYDKPLIQYPIELALKSHLFNSIWVNTESDELGEYVRKLGVNFHKRPIELSNDNATNREFIFEFLKIHKCDYVVMINPTSPLLKLETLKKYIKYIQDNNFDTIMSVVNYQAETFYNEKPINFTYKDAKINSQYIVPVKIVIWALTAWKRDTFIINQDQGTSPVFGGKIGLFSIPKDESADLDNEEDWNIAEGVISSRIRLEHTNKKYIIFSND